MFLNKDQSSDIDFKTENLHLNTRHLHLKTKTLQVYPVISFGINNFEDPKVANKK